MLGNHIVAQTSSGPAMKEAGPAPSEAMRRATPRGASTPTTARRAAFAAKGVEAHGTRSEAQAWKPFG